ncbi:flagellar basal body-associated FliL family protein [Pseudomonas oligotrophica]|uniref:flagellar basal body-associated FliL family protein n=1 Tax=Pseudomonas oligotrophica TaxID=2912055 RepID=UPI001F39B65E|nr:flagellar basal body-associated FliL family protein [Pseudomonas oligotrophica]MCF7200613.1 flagellar basal body-associated FliL family protein [Pseudomonas oligotrophica]
MSTSRVVLLMLLLNVVTVAGGVGAAYWLLRPGLGEALAASEPAAAEPLEYEFYAVPKVIVSVRGDNREHYFVLDLALQAQRAEEPRDFAQVEPLVRNSVVSYLSGFGFQELRELKIAELQARLEQALFADFASKQAAVPFEHVLVNKLIVQ